MKLVYLAGKISSLDDWRCSMLTPDMDGFNDELSSFVFVGPKFFEVQHGCSARSEHEGHAVMENAYPDRHSSSRVLNEEDVINECLSSINICDIVFAWITNLTCFGTIFELGFAAARQKLIIVGTTEEIRMEAWFPVLAATVANGHIVIVNDRDLSPKKAFIEGLKAVGEYLPAMKYEDYLQTEHWKRISDNAKHYAGHRCQLYNSSGVLHTHHRTYERRGFELPSDLIVLCSKCHARFHDVKEL